MLYSSNVEKEKVLLNLLPLNKNRNLKHMSPRTRFYHYEKSTIFVWVEIN